MSLQQLGRAEAVDVDVLRHLRHVAAVRRLVEDHVDTVEGREDGGAVADVADAELGAVRKPGGRAAAVGLRLQVVQDADRPALAEQQVHDVRADQAGAARDERAATAARRRVPATNGHEMVTPDAWWLTG